MPSGNFLIGKEGLSLKGFDGYIEPLLKSKGYSVNDKLEVSGGGISEGSILTSISGNGDLEWIVNDVLVEAHNMVNKEELERKIPEMVRTMRSFHIPTSVKYVGSGEGKVCVEKAEYTTIGIYQENETASQLFPSIAQRYLLDRVRIEVDRVSEKVKSLLGKKLREL